MSSKFNLILVTAFHEQGGNVLHRHLDGHPSLFVYPFESQLATPYSSNILTPAIPLRYAYPEFTTEMSPEQAYQSVWDEELKTYLRTPWRSKFRDCGIRMDENVRLESFVKHANELGKSRASYVEAFFRSTFDAWSNRNSSGSETHYVGYSPPIGMDADKVFADFPNAQIVHIVRNPWSGYSDTIKRPFPFKLERYCQLWNMVQLTAISYAHKYRGRFHLVRYEDLISRKTDVMDSLVKSLGLPTSDKVYSPSFNGKILDSVKPWGTIVSATKESNIATANELSSSQKDAIWAEVEYMARQLGYEDFRK